MFRSQFATRCGFCWLLSTSAAALALSAAAPSWAQSGPAQHNFDIPALPLNEALRLFMQQSGIQVSYTTGDGANVRTSAVKGDLAPAAALSQLLVGTGLTYRFTAPTSAILEPAPTADAGSVQLGPVRVEGDDSTTASPAPTQAMIGNLPSPYAGGQVARGAQVGLLGNRDVMDTPFNQTSYTAQTIENLQARNLSDALAVDPSVRNIAPRYSSSEFIYIRGFLANSDIALGGLQSIAPTQFSDLDFAERIEVLKGPSALLSGMPVGGDIGGSINIVPKRAGDEPLTRVTADYTQGSQFGGHIDFGRRFGANHEFGVRINATYRDGDTSTDRQSRRVDSIVAGLDYESDRFRLSLDIGRQALRTDGMMRGMRLDDGVPVPKVPENSSNWFQPWEYIKNEESFGALHGEFDVAPNWTAFVGLGLRRLDWRSVYATGFISDAAGDFEEYPFALPSRTDYRTVEAGIRGRFDTGPISHKITVAGSQTHMTLDTTYLGVDDLLSNIYNPVFYPKPDFSFPRAPKSSSGEVSSVAIADAMSILDDRLQVIAGVRRQQVKAASFDPTTGSATSSYNESAWTPAVGFILKPWRNVSIYGNYIEGLQQGDIVGSDFANSGQVFPPYKSKQYEAGIKVDWGRFTTTASLFQIAQPNTLSIPTTPLPTLQLNGEQRNRGLEINVFGELTPGVRLLGGVSFIKAEQTKTQDGVNEGKRAVGVPDVQLNLGAEWDTPFLPGFTLNGLIVYTGKQYYDPDNSRSLPTWTRLDLGARYKFDLRGTPVTVRAGVTNVLDANYWAGTSTNLGLSMGAPRTLTLSASVDF